MNEADTRMAKAYWEQSPNCPVHYIKALDLYLEHKDVRMVEMSPKHFEVMARKGLAKGKFMGLDAGGPKSRRSKGKGGA